MNAVGGSIPPKLSGLITAGLVAQSEEQLEEPRLLGMAGFLVCTSTVMCDTMVLPTRTKGSVMDLEQRIALGIKFLDDVKPGWAGEIDTDELDLEDPQCCVLGQLYREEAETVYAETPFSGYTIGGFRLHDWLVKNEIYTDEEIGAAQELAGFERLCVYGEVSSHDTYAEMQYLWHSEIVGRQTAASVEV